MNKFFRLVCLALIITLALPHTAQAQQSSYNGTVASEVGGLRLRATPSESSNILNVLSPNTQVKIVGRTAESGWLEVFTPQNQKGWVARIWIRTMITIATLPTTFNATVAATPLPKTVTPTPAPLPTITVQPNPVRVDFPVISGVTDNARKIFLRGQQLGNRADIFSKIGDSITAGTKPSESPFLVPIGNKLYNLAAYPELQEVIDHFSQNQARDANSFANTSLAARMGWASWQAMSLPKTPTDPCRKDETPLACEYREVKPAVAIIMFGTNDVRLSSLATYEKYMRLIIQTSIEAGVIPIISTIPPIKAEWGIGKSELYNAIVIKLAREYDVPLIDYYTAMNKLPNSGVTADGVHPSLPPYYQFAVFTDKNLQYGYTLRNLLAVQALDKVWREAMR